MTGVVARSHYLGLYAQDNWRVSPHITINALGSLPPGLQRRWPHHAFRNPGPAPVGVFNLVNTVNLDNPVATLNSPAFGRITSLAGGTAPRSCSSP